MNRQQRRAEQKQGAGRGRASEILALFNDAIQHHQAGRAAEAIPRYQAALQIKPDFPEAHYNLGIALGDQGRFAEAAASYGQVIAFTPNNADAHNNLGNAQREQGQYALAIASFQRALKLKPGYAEAHNNLGNALRDAGQLDAAALCFRQAIALKPDFAAAHSNLGNALQEQDQLDEAVTACGTALTLQPNFPEAHNNLGNALRALERDEAATGCYRTAIALRATFPEAHKNLGNMHERAGRLDDAIASYRTALGHRPSFAEAHWGLGQTLHEQGALDLAEAACRQAILFKPDLADAHNTLGNVLLTQRRLDAAMACFHRAIELQPDMAEAHTNLGNALSGQRRLDAAVESYHRSLALKPDLAETHFQLATALLTQGDLAVGWREYEWRWRRPGMDAHRRGFAQLQWQGEPGQGRTLLIHAEQGFGDTLHFCRYAALATARGLRVIIEAPKPLARLLRSLPDVTVIESGAALPHFDLHCPMLSLPLALGTTLATIPGAVPYLQAEPGAVAAWQTRLAAHPGPRIGLIWSGSALAQTDSRRSLAPDQVAPLLAQPGLQFFSLQKDAAGVLPLIDFMDEMADFADTAALIAALDLVIAVDTAAAHLAAALGKTVWLLDRFDADWRWLDGRRDSPWYPSLRIYRQPSPGDWESVIAAVVADLPAYASASR